MNVTTLTLIIVALFLPLWGYVTCKWWNVFNSPDGERYRKRRMQGPFVPLRAEEISSDAARKR